MRAPTQLRGAEASCVSSARCAQDDHHHESSFSPSLHHSARSHRPQAQRQRLERNARNSGGGGGGSGGAGGGGGVGLVMLMVVRGNSKTDIDKNASLSVPEVPNNQLCHFPNFKQDDFVYTNFAALLLRLRSLTKMFTYTTKRYFVTHYVLPS